MLAAVGENAKSLKFASADLKIDRQVALMALTSDVSVALKSVRNLLNVFESLSKFAESLKWV